MAKDDELYIQASLDIKKSLSNIKTDIKTINEKLKDTKTGQAKIIAGLNITDTRKLIKQQLDQVGSKLNLKVSAEIKGLKNINDEINKASSGRNRKRPTIEVDTSKLNTEINRVTTAYENLQLKFESSKFKIPDELKTQLVSVRDEINRINNSTEKVEPTSVIQLDTQIKTLNSDLTVSQKQSQILANSLNFETDKQKLSNRITQWLNENTKAGKRLRSEMEALQQKINDVDNKSDFDNLNKQFQQLDKYARATNQSGKSLLDTLTNNFGKLTNLLSIGNVVSQATSSIRDAINDLKDIDTTLTEISKTSDKTNSELKQLGQDSFDTASKYGIKAKDYLYGVQEMSRSGYENAEQMAEVSTLAQSAGDMTSEMANKYLIATDAAYKYNGSIEKLTATLDGQNFITNHNSVSMTDLAEATSIVASQAANAGIAEDQLSAILGTMISKSKQSGSEMANAFKAILVNIQQIKGYTDEETGETFDEESFTKYEKAAEALGVSFKEMKNGVLSLRDPVTILEDLANAYNELDPSDTKRANLLNSVGGKLRANALDVLLSNWDSYKKMLSEFSQGTGSAAEEGRKSAKNWEGSLNRFSNTWDEFVSGFVDGDKATGVLSFFTKAIELADFLTDHLGTLGTALTGIMAYRGFKNEGGGKLKLTPPLKYALP